MPVGIRLDIPSLPRTGDFLTQFSKGEFEGESSMSQNVTWIISSNHTSLRTEINQRAFGTASTVKICTVQKTSIHQLTSYRRVLNRAGQNRNAPVKIDIFTVKSTLDTPNAFTHLARQPSNFFDVRIRVGRIATSEMGLT